MRILKALVLALTLAFLSAPAWGDSAPPDPNIIMAGGGGSQDTTAGGSAADPIFVTDYSVTDFRLTGPPDTLPGTLLYTALYVEVVSNLSETNSQFAAEDFTCTAVPPTSTSCGFISPQGLFSYIPEGFSNVASCTDYSGATIACPAVEAVFYGAFTDDEDIRISVVPEPATMLLLLVGLAFFFAFAFKKRRTILA